MSIIEGEINIKTSSEFKDDIYIHNETGDEYRFKGRDFLPPTKPSRILLQKVGDKKIETFDASLFTKKVIHPE